VVDAAAEAFLTGFLTTLGEADRRMAAKAAELMAQPEWSGVTWRLGAAEMNVGEPGQYLALDGYIDGELRGVGGLSWTVEAKRCGTAWELERGVTLNADDDPLGTRYRVATLPIVTISTSAEFIEAFVGLVDELLALPAPRAR
jgi:hypothetical protein